MRCEPLRMGNRTCQESFVGSPDSEDCPYGRCLLWNSLSSTKKKLRMCLTFRYNLEMLLTMKEDMLIHFLIMYRGLIEPF